MLARLLSLFLTLILLSGATSTMGANITTTFASPINTLGEIDNLVINVSHDLATNEFIQIDYILPNNGGSESQTLKVTKNNIKTYSFNLQPAVPANTVFQITVHFPDGSTETRLLNENNPLPVELVSFRGEKAEKQVNL